MIIAKRYSAKHWYGFESVDEFADFFKVKNVNWVQGVVNGERRTIGTWFVKEDDGTTECIPHASMTDSVYASFKNPQKLGGIFNMSRKVSDKKKKKVISTGYCFEGEPAVCPKCHKVLTRRITQHLTKCIGNLDYEVVPGGVIHVYEKVRGEDNL